MIFDLRQRPLFAALSISLVLHLLVLFAGELPRSAPPGGETVTPQLQVLVRADAVPVAAPVPSPVKKAGGAPQPVPRAQQQPQTVPPVLQVPASPATPPATASPAPAAAVISPPAATGEMRNPSDGAVAGSVGGSTVSADGLRQYRIDLASATRRFRGYPALARSRGWEGVAEVVVVVDVAGAPATRLARSSGHALLDEQALEMLGRAVAQTPLPESLRGRHFTVTLPIRFSLEE